ncbi:MAG: hypothetical protein ACRC5M_00980 [Anaeroplasmataceae bacterium]
MKKYLYFVTLILVVIIFKFSYNVEASDVQVNNKDYYNSGFYVGKSINSNDHNNLNFYSWNFIFSNNGFSNYENGKYNIGEIFQFNYLKIDVSFYEYYKFTSMTLKYGENKSYVNYDGRAQEIILTVKSTGIDINFKNHDVIISFCEMASFKYYEGIQIFDFTPPKIIGFESNDIILDIDKLPTINQLLRNVKAIDDVDGEITYKLKHETTYSNDSFYKHNQIIPLFLSVTDSSGNFNQVEIKLIMYDSMLANLCYSNIDLISFYYQKIEYNTLLSILENKGYNIKHGYDVLIDTYSDCFNKPSIDKKIIMQVRNEIVTFNFEVLDNDPPILEFNEVIITSTNYILTYNEIYDSINAFDLADGEKINDINIYGYYDYLYKYNIEGIYCLEISVTDSSYNSIKKVLRISVEKEFENNVNSLSNIKTTSSNFITTDTIIKYVNGFYESSYEIREIETTYFDSYEISNEYQVNVYYEDGSCISFKIVVEHEEPIKKSKLNSLVRKIKDKFVYIFKFEWIK